MDIKWIKLDTGIFDNKKILQIEALPDGDAVLVIWLKLLVLAGNINESGMLYFTKDIPYTDQMLATQFRRPLPTVQMALKVFEQFGMVELVDDVLMVSNWEKYQNVEAMDKAKEQNRLRQQRYRDRVRIEDKSNVTRNVTNNVTSHENNDIDIDIDIEEDIDKDIDIEKDKEIEKDKDNKKDKDIGEKRKRFIPPTPEEVQAYCDEKGYLINGEHFVDFYTARNWMIGKSKMADWKAAVRTWVNRDKAKYSKPVENTNNVKRSQTFADEMQAALARAREIDRGNE